MCNNAYEYPCLNEIEIGGFTECRAPIKYYNMCPEHCKYFVKDEIESKWQEKEWGLDYSLFCKTSWNEPRRRCYEGIPIDKKIPKTHKDEWEWKQYWIEEYKNFMIKWFGPIWCIEKGII